MIEQRNATRNIAKVSKQNLFLSLLSVSCLILSLAVFYPMSMAEDKYGERALTILAISFYFFQCVSFILAIVTLLNSFLIIRRSKLFGGYFTLVISIFVFAVFVYEFLWLINHI
jgi:hypothetical protein